MLQVAAERGVNTALKSTLRAQRDETQVWAWDIFKHSLIYFSVYFYMESMWICMYEAIVGLIGIFRPYVELS